MKRYMAFDYGSKRIGVATGQRITSTAEPIAIVKVSAKGVHWQEIDKLIQTWRPAEIVVGLPLNMDGTHSESITPLAEKFAEALKKAYPYPVHMMDERLSTNEARLDLMGNESKTQGDYVDAYAAKLILESWFSTQ